MKKFIFFIISIFLSIAAYAQPPNIVYRADIDDPDTVMQLGGFYPRGMDETRPNQPPPDISLFNHVNGAATGLARHDSGYVSTTTSLNLAHYWVNSNLAGIGYIYYIHPTGNFVDVNGTLRQFSPHPGEQEYASLGRIYWQQVTGWRRVNFGVMEEFVPNRQYNHALFDTAHAGGVEPQLAGFEPNHIAWTLEPWRDFANCLGNLVDQNQCNPKETAQEFGEDAYNKYFQSLSSTFINLYGSFPVMN